MMIGYPKIETLYDRNDRFKVMPDALRMPEFGLIQRWLVTEKVDGTNIRIHLAADGSVVFGGRTDNAQIPAHLVQYLRTTFTDEAVRGAFEPGVSATLFGEGYGAKIQNGGAYRQGVSFRLFDVLVGEWWLEPNTITDVAAKLNIATVPFLGEIARLPMAPSDLEEVLGGSISIVSQEDGGSGMRAEGIVARTVPGLFTRKGERLMWKLKFKDF